mgnify:CR=1 FL=1
MRTSRLPAGDSGKAACTFLEGPLHSSSSSDSSPCRVPPAASSAIAPSPPFSACSRFPMDSTSSVPSIEQLLRRTHG